MARKKSVPPRKKRTREHVIADLSVNHVERQFLLCGYAVERRYHDYGLDLIVSTFDDQGNFENGEIHVQVKATDRLRLVARGQMVTCRIERTDLRAWLENPMPVILVVYDAPAEEGYWLYVQQHFQQNQPGFDPARGSGDVTVRIPRANVLNPAAVRDFARWKNVLLLQMEGLQHGSEE